MTADQNSTLLEAEKDSVRDILGSLVDAPTVQLLLPQAHQIPRNAWEVIKGVLERNVQARDDIRCLTELLSDTSSNVMGATMGSLSSNDVAESSSFSIKPSGKLELTDDCHHYTGNHEVPWDIQKYFSQRYSIFSLYDNGVCMTDDAWFGVTPEPVANQIANEMFEATSQPKKTVLVDAFCGAGGNTIAFALSERWDLIIAIERDAATLACAQNNAEVYGVDPSSVAWIHGDSFEFLDKMLNDPEELHPDLRLDPRTTMVFASPPWGGPGYKTDKIFDLTTMQPYSLGQLYEAYRRMDHVLYLPRTSDLRQIAKLAPKDRKIEVIQYCMEGASKAMGVYIPGDAPTASTE